MNGPVSVWRVDNNAWCVVQLIKHISNVYGSRYVINDESLSMRNKLGPLYDAGTVTIRKYIESIKKQ